VLSLTSNDVILPVTRGYYRERDCSLCDVSHLASWSDQLLLVCPFSTALNVSYRLTDSVSVYCGYVPLEQRAGSYEPLVPFYHHTRRHIPKDRLLHTVRFEKLRTHQACICNSSIVRCHVHVQICRLAEIIDTAYYGNSFFSPNTRSSSLEIGRWNKCFEAVRVFRLQLLMNVRVFLHALNSGKWTFILLKLKRKLFSLHEI
jgi:hypothetical protein